MTGYVVGVTRYENFGPFQDATVDFSKPGLTVIEGLIDKKRGCDSNGAGKSFLFDGVVWALYGRCIREKYSGDDVIRVGQKGGTCVTVTIKGDVTITVKRHRKHPVHKDNVLLFVGGENVTRGTNPETTLAIEQAIGMDFLSFVNSVAFGARDDVKSFFVAPDSERKKIMEKILGLELYAEAEKVARRRAREAAESMNTLNSTRTTLQATIAEKKAKLDQMKNSQSKAELEVEHKRQALVVKKLETSITQIDVLISTLNAGLEEETEKAQDAVRKYERALADYNNAKLKAETEKRRAEREIATIDGQQKQIEARKQKITAQAGKNCPTCQQVVAKKLTDTMIAACDDEMKAHRSARLKFELVLDQQDAVLKDLKAPVEPEFPQIDEKKEQLQKERLRRTETVGKKNTESAKLKQIGDEIARLETMASDLKDELKDAEKELADTDKQYRELEVKVNELQFWVDAFGNSGLKSFLIEAEIPAINEKATGYARRLLGDGAHVRLSATKELKSRAALKEELTVEGYIPGCTNSYNGASKGQRKRLDLCLVLAFRDLVASRTSKAFRQMFVDELFDGLDRSGCESVVTLLRDIVKDCPISMITHDPRIKPAGDQFIFVHHNGSLDNPVAKILAHGATQATIPVGKPLKKTINKVAV